MANCINDGGVVNIYVEEIVIDVGCDGEAEDDGEKQSDSNWENERDAL